MDRRVRKTESTFDTCHTFLGERFATTGGQDDKAGDGEEQNGRGFGDDGRRAAAGESTAEISLPHTVVGWCVGGTESIAPHDEVCRIDETIAVEITVEHSFACHTESCAVSGRTGIL